MTHLPAELRGIYPTWLNKHNAPIAARGECMKCLFSSHYVIRLIRCFSIAVSKFFEILPVLMQWFMIIPPRDPGATRQRAAQTSPHLTPGK